MLLPYSDYLSGKKIILASGSPRRQHILQDLGLTFRVEESDFPENLDKTQFTQPWNYAMETATQKALNVYERLSKSNTWFDILISADTIVVHGNVILEKPSSPYHAREILSSLSDSQHDVITAVVLLIQNDQCKEVSWAPRTKKFYETTTVEFASLTMPMIDEYIKTGSGSGKSTLVNEIIKFFGSDNISVLRQDAYYRDLSNVPLMEILNHNFDHPDSIESELLIHHINLLKSRQVVQVPIYDFKAHCRLTETIENLPHKVVLVEGILVLSEPELRNLLDIKIFVDTEDDIRFIRRLQRDVKERGRTFESVIEQYFATVRPMHLEFVEPSKRYADVIIPEGGYNKIAIEMITSHISKCLSS